MRLLHRLLLPGAWILCQYTHAQTFVSALGLPGRDERGMVLHRSTDGGLFLGGSVGDSCLVQRMDELGNVIWARAFRPPSAFPTSVYDLTSAADGSIIGCGNGRSGTGATMVNGFWFRMDTEGNVAWLRQWDLSVIYAKRIVPLNADEYLLFGDHYDMGQPTSADVFNARVDAASGEVLWSSPQYDLNAALPYIDDVAAVTTVNGAHYATGRIFTNGSSVSTCRVAVTRYTSAGEHDWTKYLLYANTLSRRMYPTDIIAHDDSLTVACFGDITGATTNYAACLIRMDTLGNVAWARHYDVPGSGQEVSGKLVATSQGYVLSGAITQGDRKLFLLGVSFSGDAIWGRTYGSEDMEQVIDFPSVTNLIDVGDGVLLTGTVIGTGTERDILLVRTNEFGVVECGGQDTLVVSTTVLPTDGFPRAIGESALFAGTTGLPVAISATYGVPPCTLLSVFGADISNCGDVLLDATTSGATYTWSDGSTGPGLLATTSGTYWVTLAKDCCTLTDSVDVSIDTAEPLDLGPDIASCDQDEFVLTVTGPYDAVIWQDGNTDFSYTVTQSGTYSVQAFQGSCSTTDTIQVSIGEPPAFTLGADAQACEGDTVQLSTGLQNIPHLWQDGTTVTQLDALASGTYWVIVGEADCATSDTVIVSFTPIPVVDLGEDFDLCAGATAELGPISGAGEINWSTGTTAQSITVEQAGTYWALVDDAGCTASDTVIVGTTAMPVVQLGADVLNCDGESVELMTVQASGGDPIWSTGASGPSLVVEVSGNYSLSVSNGCGSASDTIAVTIAGPVVVDLGPDTVLCGAPSLFLNSGWPASMSLWQDGQYAAEQLVESAGTYHVLVDDQGCTGTDSITVGMISVSDGPVVIPNVISPNGDGVNDRFLPLGEGYGTFALSVFNRWGLEVHLSADPSFGWDGTQNSGDPVPEGTYFYVMSLQPSCEGKERMRTITGHVTVLR